MCTETTRDVGVARQLNGCTLVQPLAQDKPVVLFVIRQPIPAKIPRKTSASSPGVPADDLPCEYLN